MLRSKHIERICCIIVALCVVLTCGVMTAVQSGTIEVSRIMGYENRLFDQSRVHQIDIIMQDWDSFIATCTSEEYSACNLVIDGEAYKNVAIRGKGNTSLSSVAQFGNGRYSFKVEFDHYDNSISYHGLDKLSLNNIIQDATHLKDYLAYTLMGKMGVASPLCSFVQINVNGSPWGLYLAVEGVEDSFLARNYGSDAGELYKPDSMSFGGGRGNGRDFDMADFDFGDQSQNNVADVPSPQSENNTPPSDFTPPDNMNFGDSFAGSSGQSSASANPSSAPSENSENDQRPSPPEGDFDFGKGGGFGGGMFGGNSDVKLQYSDDNPSSYSNIFNNAKTDVSSADQARLIASLKALSTGDTAVVDTDQVMRYMAVHHFLCNDDSYTGMMVHNYYLHETDGVLSLIPWDYNLAFGGFSGGMSGATGTVNSPIDSPVSSGSASDRPLIGWIWNSEETKEAYHQVYRQFMDTVFNSGWFSQELERVIAMIDPYVKADENGFFTYEEFQKGVDTLRIFCEKRAQSLNGQLNGSIPTTSAGQRNSDTLIDASEINISDMGGMNTGGPGGGGPSMPGGDFEMPEGMTPPEGFQMPGDGQMPTFGDSSGQSSAPAATAAPTLVPTSSPAPAAPQMGNGAPDLGDSSGDSATFQNMTPPDGASPPAGFQAPPDGQMLAFGDSSGQSSAPVATAAPTIVPTSSPAPTAPQMGNDAPDSGDSSGDSATFQNMTPPDGASPPAGFQAPPDGQVPDFGDSAGVSSAAAPSAAPAPEKAPYISYVPLVQATSIAQTSTPATSQNTPLERPDTTTDFSRSRSGMPSFSSGTRGNTSSVPWLWLSISVVLLAVFIAIAAKWKGHI